MSTLVKGTLTVGKAQGSISDVSDIGKVSDGTSVEDPDFAVVGDGEVTIEYFSGDDKLDSAPAIAGNYKVVITLLDGENYVGTKVFAEFVIEALKPKYKVEAGEGAPVISSGGLESLFGNPVDDPAKGITQQELDEAEDIEITLIAGKADISAADEELLKEFVGDNDLGVLIDISLIKKVTYPGGDIIETGLTELSDVIEISIPIPQELKDKTPLKVYRIHDGVVSEFSLAPDENGEFYKIVGDDIIVYSRFFSTYAIGYEDDTSPQTSDDFGHIPMIAILISLISILSLVIVSVKRRKIQMV